MAINDDVHIDIVNKIVRRETGAGATIYTVNALYTFIQDTMDELSGSEGNISVSIPMSAQTPTSYTMINGWYIQNELTQFLEGGAIQTNGYNGEIATLTLDGTYTNAVASDLGKQVTDDSSEVGALLDYDNVAQKWFIRTTSTIADNSVMAITAGTGAGDASGASVNTGETVFANPYTLGTLEGSPQLYIYQDGSKVAGWWSTGHFDILIKVTENGTDINSKKITVLGRTWTDSDTVFEITLTTAGQNAVPLGTADDLNNQTAEATVEDWQDGTISSIAIDFSFASPYLYDIGDGAGAQPYNVRIDADGQRLANNYEVCKYWVRAGSTKQLEQDSDGNFINGEAYRYADSSYTEVVPSPLGTFAGGKFFAAQGVHFINLHADDVQNFQLIDNNGVTRSPPNYQSLGITNIVNGVRCSIFKTSGGEIDKSQYTATAQSSGASTITIAETIPADTPASGTIIMVDVSTNTEQVYTYTSWSGSVFNLSGTTSVAYTTSDTAYVPYIYEEATGTSISTSVIYVEDRTVMCRVRLKGYLPFETSGVFSATGYSASAILTTDGIVS